MGRKTSKYAKKRRYVDPLAGMLLLDRARPFDHGDTTAEHIKTRACFDRLADGTADVDDFDRVAMVFNVAKVRALQIDQGLADILQEGQNAMQKVQNRYERWGKWDMLPAERVVVIEALDAHEAITDASSPLQMLEALKVVRGVIQKQIERRA